MDLAGQRYAHLKFDLKLKRPTYRTGVPKSRIQKRTSDSCSATPKTQGIPRFQKLIRIFVTMATPGSRLVRDFETSSLKYLLKLYFNFIKKILNIRMSESQSFTGCPNKKHTNHFFAIVCFQKNYIFSYQMLSFDLILF